MTGEPFFPCAAVLQFAVSPGEVEKNLERVQQGLASLDVSPGSLVLLPELWATGLAPDNLAALTGQTPGLLDELAALARAHDCLLGGSLPEMATDQDKPFNTFFLVSGNGVLGRYQKQHLFSFWREDEHFRPGSNPEPIRTAHGDIATLVCYDLRFPELARKQIAAGTQLLVVSAQWPLTRIDQWRILLQARAVENQTYVVAANSCGEMDGTIFGGHSMIIAPDGRIQAEAGEHEQAIAATLAPEAVVTLRQKFCPVGEHPWLTDDATKIRTLDEARELIRARRSLGSRIAFTNGCFDILHAGHVSYLETARRTADMLVVGVNSDRSVRAIKGPERPVNSEQERMRVLAALGCVDLVVLFDEETPLQLITTLLPDVLVKGADWPEDQIVGAPEVKAAGGRVARIRFAHDCSTTRIIDRIRQDLG